MSGLIEPPLWHSFPNAPAPGAWLANVTELPEGQVTLRNIVADAAQAKPFGVLLLRSGDEVKAFVNRCAHFGVPLAAKQEHLIFKSNTSITCNVHYARFRWNDGFCEYGDCEGESLSPIPLQMDADGQIFIADSVAC